MTDSGRFAAAEALATAGRLEEARAAFEAALAAGPDDPAARTRLGQLCRTLDDLDGAIAAFERVAAALPDEEAARLNLAAALDEAGEHARALDLANHAPTLLATSPDARWLAAPVFMHAGDFERGLECLEARWQTGDPAHVLRPYREPLWRSEPGTGQLLLWQEQGLGDSLLALRFAGRAAALGWTVVAEPQAAVAPLAAGMRGVAEVLRVGDAPTMDRHLPMMSLPWALGVRAADAGADLPALTVPPERLVRWSARLPPTDRLRVGLAWRSTIVRDNPEVVRNKLGKSMPLASLASFADIPGVEWVSLQVGEGMDEAARVPALRLVDLTTHIRDLADTAALMAHLDLVVSIDTVTAHLAGCLGMPLIVLGMQVPDWRWHVAGGGSPWYPAARVFRQRRRHDWRDAVTEAAEAIHALASGRRPEGVLARAARWLKGR